MRLLGLLGLLALLGCGEERRCQPWRTFDPVSRRCLLPPGRCEVDGHCAEGLLCDREARICGRCTPSGWCQLDVPEAVRGVNLTAVAGAADGAGEQLWVVGERGTVLRLPQGEVLRNLPPAPFTAVWGPTADDFWAVGRGEIVLRCQRCAPDAWWPLLPHPAKIYPRHDLFSLSGDAMGRLWAAGALGKIVRWDAGTAYLEERNLVRRPERIPGVTSEYRGVWAGGHRVWVVGTERTGLWTKGYAVAHDPADRAPPEGQTFAGRALAAVFGLRGAEGDTVWVAGQLADPEPLRRRGLVLRHDGTWSEHRMDRPEALHGVSGSGPGDVWVVGEGGAIHHWDGAAWSAVDSGVQQALRGVWAGPGAVWAVGDGGVVLRYRRPP